MSRLNALWVVVLLLSLAGVLAAQQPEKETTLPPAVEKKSLDLLDSIAGRISTLHSPENRITVTCAVADLLWSRDEKRARALFANVMRDEAALVSSVDLGDQQASENYSTINNQRQEVVGRIARHDPDLALEFLRATRFPAGEVPSYGANWERNLELSLSRAIAAKDPERALKLARESLAKGLSYDFVSLLMELEQKNKPAAQSLYESLVSRIQSEDLARNQEAANIATNLINSFQPPKANEDEFRDLLETVIKAALSLTPNDPQTQQVAQNYLGSLFSSMQLVEKYAPARVRAVKDWSQSITRTMDPNNQLYSELNQTAQEGTIDDILALATRFPEEMRNQVYQQAAWKASNNGDVDRARQLISDHITDPYQRRQMLQQLDNQLTWKAINENKLVEARSLLSRTTSPEQRFQLLMQIASQLTSKNNKKEALECLVDAREAVNAVPRGSSRMWQQLQLASAFEPLDLDQSFAIMQGIVAELNQLVMAAAVMDGFDNRYLRRGEWMLNGQNNLTNIVNNSRLVISQLARLDFDRAQTLSDQLERPEIRLMTQLEMVQSLLNDNTVSLLMVHQRTFIE
ncbi:MAG TPA: hypothetical protein VIV66_01440 [Pyrinomonadaceae bacterium]